jgi:hypothetical protein
MGAMLFAESAIAGTGQRNASVYVNPAAGYQLCCGAISSETQRRRIREQAAAT